MCVAGATDKCIVYYFLLNKLIMHSMICEYYGEHYSIEKAHNCPLRFSEL